jgi:hypothetical protein
MKNRKSQRAAADFICNMSTSEWIAYCNAMTPETRQMLLGDAAPVSLADFEGSRKTVKTNSQYNEKKAMRQGWLLANTGKKIEIQRYDKAERFSSDAEALKFVKVLAKNGDEHAKFCLRCLTQTRNNVPWAIN